MESKTVFVIIGITDEDPYIEVASSREKAIEIRDQMRTWHGTQYTEISEKVVK